jgi:hypothetical protein
MKTLTKKQIIKDVHKAWMSQYPKDKDGIGKLLVSCKTEKEVIEVIGNDTWTQNKCYECDKDVDVTITLGEEPDYESYTTTICKDCLIKALELMNETKP